MSQKELIKVKSNSNGDRKISVETPDGDPSLDYVIRSSSLEAVKEEINLIEFYDGKCGVFGCTPKWLQIFNSPIMLLFSLSSFSILQGSVATGFIAVALSSIERRYNLTSALSALAATSYEIGEIIFILFTSYLGGRSHKPRVLGVSLLVIGIGSLIFASPHYFTSTYNLNRTLTEVCDENSTHETVCTTPFLYIYPLFIIGNVIIGSGASTLYTVGLGFIDDSTHPRYSPIYISVSNIIGIIGPLSGFVLGGVFLTLFVNPFTPTTLTSSDPQWVGAWWIGFVLTGVFSVFGSIQFFFYPRRLKGSRQYDTLRKKMQPLQDQGVSFEEDYNISILTMMKEYPVYLRRILKNATFLLVTFGIASAAFVISGVITFLPKYFEIQYSVSPSVASYLSGAVSIPAAALGLLLGGITLFVFKKLTVERLALCVFILTLIEVLAPPLFLLGCSSIEVAGVNVNYQNSTGRTNHMVHLLNVSCFSSCDCASNIYHPVCSKGVTYFSPCLAGCSQEMDAAGLYSNCSCLNASQLASDGKCVDDCTVQIVISCVLFFSAVTLIFYNTIPFVKLTLRCVADKDRTVALGVQSFALRILGHLPGPLVIGVIFDLNCILWGETDCGTRGACLEYDSLTLKYSLIAVMFIAVSISSFMFFLAWITWKCRKIQEHDAQD